MMEMIIITPSPSPSRSPSPSPSQSPTPEKTEYMMRHDIDKDNGDDDNGFGVDMKSIKKAIIKTIYIVAQYAVYSNLC